MFGLIPNEPTETLTTIPQETIEQLNQLKQLHTEALEKSGLTPAEYQQKLRQDLIHAAAYNQSFNIPERLEERTSTNIPQIPVQEFQKLTGIETAEEWEFRTAAEDAMRTIQDVVEACQQDSRGMYQQFQKWLPSNQNKVCQLRQFFIDETETPTNELASEAQDLFLNRVEVTGFLLYLIETAIIFQMNHSTQQMNKTNELLNSKKGENKASM